MGQWCFKHNSAIFLTFTPSNTLQYGVVDNISDILYEQILSATNSTTATNICCLITHIYLWLRSHDDINCFSRSLIITGNLRYSLGQWLTFQLFHNKRSHYINWSSSESNGMEYHLHKNYNLVKFVEAYSHSTVSLEAETCRQDAHMKRGLYLLPRSLLWQADDMLPPRQCWPLGDHPITSENQIAFGNTCSCPRIPMCHAQSVGEGTGLLCCMISMFRHIPIHIFYVLLCSPDMIM